MCRAKFYKQWSAKRICDECEETQAAQEDEHMHMQDAGVHTEGAEAETDEPRGRQPSSVQGHPGAISAVGVASARHAATRDVARPLIDYRAMNERADRIAAAQQLRLAG